MQKNDADIAAKYYRLLARVKQIKQDGEKTKTELEKTKNELKKKEKKARDFCEEILKKEIETDTGAAQKGKSWGTTKTVTMIENARASYAKNESVMSDLYKKMIEANEERSEKISKLKKQLEILKDEQDDDDLPLQEEEDRDDESTPANEGGSRDSRNISTPNKKKAEEIVITEEDEDYGEQDMDIDFINEGLAGRSRGRTGIKHRDSTKRIEHEQKKQEERKAVSDKETDRLMKNLNDDEYNIIYAIGHYGYSEYKTISDWLHENRNMKNSRVRSQTQNLVSKGIIYSEKGEDIPTKPNIIFHRLTETGKDIFLKKYGHEACVSEMEKIISEHTSIAHGYGIKITAEMIRDSEYFKDRKAVVEYINGRKPIPVSDNTNEKYVPDITIRVPEKDLIYIEYETNKCSEDDLFRKCNKMLRVTENLYFIAPSPKSFETLKMRLNKWVEMQKNDTQGRKKFCLYATSYKTLAENLSTESDNEERTKKESKFLFQKPGNPETGMVKYIR